VGVLPLNTSLDLTEGKNQVQSGLFTWAICFDHLVGAARASTVETPLFGERLLVAEANGRARSIERMDIKKGDTVEVIAGNHKGERGEVQRVIRGAVPYGKEKGAHEPNRDRVVVAGVNLVIKHQKPTGQGRNPQGGRIEMEAPLHHSNVMVVCPHCKRPTRVGHDRASGKKVRVCKHPDCGQAIDQS
jgi:large subunit ribosomal protein L24